MAGLSQYLTVNELLNAPTGIDLKSIAPPGATGPAGVTAQQWYRSLMDVIYRGSSLIDNYLQQTLIAATDTEELWTDGWRAGLDQNGYLWIEAANFPVISISAFQYGWPSIGAMAWTLPVLTDLIVMGPRAKRIVYPASFPGWRSPPLRIQFTYLNGYPNTVLTASVTQGATTLALADLTGITALERLTIYDEGNTEQVQVSSGFVPATGAGNVTLASGTAFAHTIVVAPATPPNQPYDIAVSALPPDVKMAAILICKELIEVRGTSALVMGRTGGVSGRTTPASKTFDIPDAAALMLNPYRRIV